MYHINDVTYKKLLAAAELVHTTSPYSIQKRLSCYPVVRSWDARSPRPNPSAQWEERARLIDMPGDDLFLEVQDVFYGFRFDKDAPRFYRVNRREAYKTLLGEEMAAKGEAQNGG